MSLNFITDQLKYTLCLKGTRVPPSLLHHLKRFMGKFGEKLEPS